jgi:thiamine biosynthesis lipoprotein
VSEGGIHVLDHHAMATLFQVRIAGEERGYAAQAAQAAFDMVDRLEALLSRFRENSEISQIARLGRGEKLRLSEPTFACLRIAREMELATRGAFSATPSMIHTSSQPTCWSLSEGDLTFQSVSGNVEFDLGAIGKGFALDRMAEELSEWKCESYLLVGGGSSILAGAAPPGAAGWSMGVGQGNTERRYELQHCSLSGSGVAVKGQHILDPRTGQPAQQRSRAWALAPSAAVSDALSTACMVLSESEIAEMLKGHAEWVALFHDGNEWRRYGDWKLTGTA